MKIPTYIINLNHRSDRYKNIRNEFEGKSEFDVTIVNAVEDSIGSFGLWKSFCQIIKTGKEKNHKYILICEDDHMFTEEYQFDKFNNQLKIAASRDADVFSGGISWFDCSLRLDNNIYWVNRFTGTQFQIIFDSLYDKILSYDFVPDFHTIDHVISELSDKVFVSVPMFSIQLDTGYSDVTKENNAKGIVKKLFDNVQVRLKALAKMQDHILSTRFFNQDINYDDLKVSTFIINLADREDRLKHIKEQFIDKNEFELEILTVKRESNGALGLWNNIQKIVALAKDNDEDVIIICEDDHAFSSIYSKEILFNSIYQGASLGADLILGGISSTRQSIIVSPELCWIDSFQCTQFTIIFKNIFDLILAESFNETDAADLKLSMMTTNKYVIHPFISKQEDFGYSDIPIDGITTAQYNEWFTSCENEISKIRAFHQLLLN